MDHIAAGPRLHTEIIGPEDEPTEVLFRALDRVSFDVKPPNVVLNDFVDPDALDNLFGGDRPAGGVGVVTFEAWGFLVDVSVDEVTLYETRSSLSVGDRSGLRTSPERTDSEV